MNKFKKLTKHIPNVYKPTVNRIWKGILEALGESYDTFDTASLETKAQLFVETAVGNYLEKLGSNVGVVKPSSIGIADADFRKLIPTLSFTPKQVRNIIWKLLEVFYSSKSVFANFVSEQQAPYSFTDGDTITFRLDDDTDIKITLSTSDFLDITAATAVEVANAINKQATEGKVRAEVFFDGITRLYYVRVRTTSPGPTGNIQVIGGTAQNVLQFPAYRTIAHGIGTQWEITIITGDTVRLEWKAGTLPDFSDIREGDIAIISGPFSDSNKGSYTVEEVITGATPYIEFSNPQATPEIVTQIGAQDVTFTFPFKALLSNIPLPAVAYEINHKELIVQLPSTPMIVGRELKGSAHVHPNTEDQVALVNNVAGLDLIDNEDIKGYDALYLEVGSGDYEIGETLTAPSGATATVKEIISNNVNSTILVVDSVGGFAVGELVTGVDSLAKRNFVKLIDGSSGEARINAIIESNARVSIDNIINSFLDGSAFIGRRIMKTIYNTNNLEDGESLSTASAMYLVPAWNGDFAINDIITDVATGAKTAKVDDVIIDKVNGLTILQVSNITGTFTVGEQVEDQATGTKWAIFDKLGTSSGATADIKAVRNNSFEMSSIELESIIDVFNEDEIIIGGTSGAKGVIGTLESSKGIIQSIEQLDSYISPYVYDKFATYTAAEVEATTNQAIISGVPLTVLNCGTIPDDWPDEEGYFILEYGIGKEEGPIKYLAKPNDNTLIIDPSYIFTQNHDSGAQVRLVSSNEATEPDTDGTDYAAYITGVAEARDLLAELIQQSVAAGITVRFIIVFPEYNWSCYNTNE